MEDEQLVFNGINAATGGYLLEPMTPAEVSQVVLRQKPDSGHLKELEKRHKRKSTKHLAVRAGVDPKDLAQTGWAVVFAQGADPKVKDALRALLQHRRQQAEAKEKYYYELEYVAGENKTAFLGRYGAAAGPADPKKVPYYLLLVGSPQDIPFGFQYQLDVAYAVGRLHFSSVEEYAQYAASVVAAETGPRALPRRAAFVGVCNAGDRATLLSSTQLVQPLAELVAASHKDWEVETWMGERARKAGLRQVLGGAQTPALLFTASHGMGFPNGDPLQSAHQGALLCQDWSPAPAGEKTPVSPDAYFSVDDVGDNAKLLGLIAFHFACYGAGTPQLDDFAHGSAQGPTAIAPHPFVARLPQRMLGHRNGGALAVLGHVERAWGYSFMSDEAGPQRIIYEDTLKLLMEGHPVGAAIECFNERYAELSTVLTEEINLIHSGQKIHERALANMWTANNDARGFVILGDPAVCLMPAAAGQATAERPAIILATPHPVAAVEEPVIDPVKPQAAPVEQLAAVDGGTIATPSIPKDSAGQTMPPITVTVTVAGQTLTATPATAGTAEAVGGEGVNFGMGDTLRKAMGTAVAETDELKERVANSLRDFTQELGKTLQGFVQDLSQLEVTTYVSAGVMEAEKGDPLAGARRRAYTRIKLDGDTETVVPGTEDGVDDELWAIHVAMVQQAQTHRTELLKAAVSAAGGLAEVLKVL